MKSVFSPVRIGDYDLANAIVMAPLTRARAGGEGIPNNLMAEYYRQRATAGMIITEATAINRQGHGWPGGPGIYTPEQIAGWKKVTAAVHRENGIVFSQLFHMGRVVLPDYADGQHPISASAVTATGEMPGPDGTPQAFQQPREMDMTDIEAATHDFARAAENAIHAGFDGAEIHAANNFLIDSFLRDGTNQRHDQYGGNAENRARFLIEIVEKTIAAIGAGRTGVRISPSNNVFGITDSNAEQTFTTVARLLNPYDLAYLHILEPEPKSGHPMATDGPDTAPAIRSVYKGKIILNGGFDLAKANGAINAGLGDAVAFGVPFISNPDLVERFQNHYPLTNAGPETFYTPGAAGYTDYPTHQSA